MSEIFDGVGEEVTLGLLDVEAVLPQAFEDLSKMLLMLSWVFRLLPDMPPSFKGIFRLSQMELNELKK